MHIEERNSLIFLVTIGSQLKKVTDYIYSIPRRSRVLFFVGKSIVEMRFAMSRRINGYLPDRTSFGGS